MAGNWQALINQPTFNASTMILLTDGRVMVQEEATAHWHALTADRYGSYVNGTWSTLADMSFWRRYYASGVLKNGRVIVIGGEQSGAGGDTNKGEIYDPVSDTWSPMPSPPGWAKVGDASCCVLPDGRFMIGNIDFPWCMIYDPTTNSWAPAGTQAVRSNEETWILLPDDTILTVECFAPFQGEKYVISADAWKNEGAPPVQLVDPVMHEIGPAMLMYNRQVIFFGAANSTGHGKTAIYAPPASATGTGSWMPGPDIPKVAGQTIVCNDCPASLLPNGKVLFAAANFQNNNWGSPVLFFEFDPGSNTISQAATPANNAAQVYWSRFMLLPTGQVLFGPSSKNIQCYTPDGGPHDDWRPRISSIVPHCSASARTYLLKGSQLNGLSQGNIYGDDCSPATNYPIVRLRNPLTNEVYFCRTFDFSTRGVTGGGTVESARFATPHLPYGNYELCVIANGISSHCVSFCHHKQKRRIRCEITVRRAAGICREKESEEDIRCHGERKPCDCEVTVEGEGKTCGCEIYEGELKSRECRPQTQCNCGSAVQHGCEDRTCEICEQVPCCCECRENESEIAELRSSLKRLENSLHRLASLIKTEELIREEKERRREEKEEKEEERSSKRK